MVTTMKIKKVQLIRPEFEVEVIRPVVGRIYLFFKFLTLCKVFKQRVQIVFAPYVPKDVKVYKCEDIYYISIPKIKVVDSV